MKILNGWKEISECLQRTPRSARRWERLGLPVRRISDSHRSPVVAFSDEIEDWVRTKHIRRGRPDPDGDGIPAFQSTRCQTQKLLRESHELCAEQQQLCAEQQRLHAEQEQLRAQQRQLREAQKQLLEAVCCEIDPRPQRLHGETYKPEDDAASQR